MPKVEIYSTPTCRFCVNAKRLFDQMGVEYTEYNVQQDPVARSMLRKSGQRTVPQIYINGEHVGGYTEVAEMKLSGRLTEKLNEEVVPKEGVEPS